MGRCKLMPELIINASKAKILYDNTVQKKWINQSASYVNVSYESSVEHFRSYVWFPSNSINELLEKQTNGFIEIDSAYVYMPENVSQSHSSKYTATITITASNATINHSAQNIPYGCKNGVAGLSIPYGGTGYSITTDGAQNAGYSLYDLTIGRALLLQPRMTTTAGTTSTYRTNTLPYIRVRYHYKESTIAVNGTVSFGQAFSASITSYSSEFTHYITYSAGNQSGSVSAAAGAASVSITIPNSWMNQIPNALTLEVKLSITTYNGEDVVGEPQSITITVNVPQSVIPLPGTLSYAVTNALNVPITLHGMTVSLSGQAGVYGSTIRSHTLSCEGYSSTNESLVVETINKIPSVVQYRDVLATATVVDSRGRTASTTLNIRVYEWDYPYFSDLTFYRCDSNGVRSDSGTYIRVQGEYLCYSVNNLNSIQPCTMKIVERNSGIEINAGNLAQDTAKIIGGGALSADNEYVVQFTLQDAVSTIVYERAVYSAAYVIHFKNGGTGVAFGQAAMLDSAVVINPAWKFIVGNNIDLTAINSLFGATDEKGVATANHAVNDFIISNGIMYKVTSAIASGEDIEPGTNCIATNFFSLLADIYSRL